VFIKVPEVLSQILQSLELNMRSSSIGGVPLEAELRLDSNRPVVKLNVLRMLEQVREVVSDKTLEWKLRVCIAKF